MDRALFPALFRHARQILVLESSRTLLKPSEDILSTCQNLCRRNILTQIKLGRCTRRNAAQPDATQVLNYSGGPSWRSQNCLCFAGLEMGSQIGHFHKHVRATLQGPYKTSLAGFRGLPRPSEASLMGFRGLPRPCEASTKSQNPFSSQDYEASGTRAYIILLKGSPQGLGPGEPWLPIFFRLHRRKGRSWLQVPFLLERGLQRLKMILQTK